MAKVAGDVGSTANRYQILAKLAAGGMAEIYLARGDSVGGVERYCVLKRILRERARDAQFVQMFLDEARLAAQLQHPNIASVYDVGMLGDSYFFTMEYVHGQTVQALVQRALAQHRALPLACVLTVVAGAAAGLHHAHERRSSDGRALGIVHRDVSPSNVMVSYEGNVKLVDFGVAKAANRGVETQSGTVKGKISYLSPEQCQGGAVDRRSDLFSLGIVLWEMLTGERLYRRATDFENMTAIVNEPPTAPSSRRRDVPRAVDDIVVRLLAKPAADRYQTAAEVVEAIEHASMRAATLLSPSAVSRLVRDLFGTPAEPWLELDGDTLPHDPVPLAVNAASASGERDAIKAVERELAAAPDLSTPPVIAALREPAATAWSSATPTASLVLSDPAIQIAAPQRPSPVHISAPAMGLPPAPPNTTALGMGAPAPWPRRKPPSAATVSSPIAAEILPAPMRHGAPHADPASSALAANRRDMASPARITWPLIAVIILAAAAGVGVVWLSTRTIEHTGGRAVVAPAPIVPAAAGSSVVASPELAAPPMRADTEIDMPVEQLTPSATANADAVAPPTVAPASAPPAAASPSTTTTTPKNATSVTPAATARNPAATTPPVSVTTLKPLYQRGSYAAVVAACRTASTAIDIARICLLAACRENDTPQARRWLDASPAAQRAQLVTNCAQVGGLELAR